jgi:hypothetical protein
MSLALLKSGEQKDTGMRLALAFLVVFGFVLDFDAVAADAGDKDEKFEICRSDDPQKCNGDLFVSCDYEAGSLALASCQKKGWKFFTLAKVRELPGGQCGSTFYSVRCQ